MADVGAEIGGLVSAGLGRGRNATLVTGATITVTAAFRLIGCTPINSSTVRVFFSREPKHVSPYATNDALYRPNWSVALTTGVIGVTEPVVESIFNLRNALATEVDLVTYPEAHSLDVQFDRRIIWNSAYTITAAAAIASSDLVNTLAPAAALPSPANACTFPGIHIQRPRRLTRALRAQTGVDISYSIFSGVFGFEANNDLATQSGNVALKKRIIRRLLSSPGGFPHLPEYGVGLRLKESIKTVAIADLRTRVRDQVLLEAEVEDAKVFISRPGPDILVVVIDIVSIAASSFSLRFSVPSTGPVRVAA